MTDDTTMSDFVWVSRPEWHTPELWAYASYGGLEVGQRLVLSEHDDRDKAQRSGAWIGCASEDVREVME